MYILSVMPISTSAHTDVLDYYSKDPVDVGMIIQVTLRKKAINALVLSSMPLAHAKHLVKNSRFALKKIIAVSGPSPISAATLQAVQSTAQYIATTSGVLIANTMPTWLFSSALKFEQLKRASVKNISFAFQASLIDRAGYYAQQSSKKRLLIICPTEQHQTELINALPTDATVYSIPQKPSAKKLSALFEKLHISHPCIIIASPVGIGLIDVLVPDALIIENESDNRYIRQKAPYIDMRIAAESIAQAHGIEYILTDTLLRAYTHARVAEKQLSYLGKPIWPSIDAITLVSYSKDPDQKTERRNPFFSDQLISVLKDSNKKTIVYVPRKGLASVVVCQDCATAVICNTCGLPQKLVERKDSQGNKKRFYICAHPEHAVPAYDICNSCGGHRLQGLGVSTLSIRDEIKKIAPKKTILILDQDEAATVKQQKNIIEEYNAHPDAILVATSLVFPYLDTSIIKIIIPSLDMLLSHPSPEAQESIMHTLSLFAEKTHASIVLQTRLPDNPIFESIKNNDIKNWFANECGLRKQYGFPPFSIWLSVRAYFSQSAIAGFQNSIAKLPMQPYSMAISQGRGSRQMQGLAVFKISSNQWNQNTQDESIVRALKGLPPGYSVQSGTRL